MTWTPNEVFSLISLGGALLLPIALAVVSTFLAKYKFAGGSTLLILLVLPLVVVWIYVFFSIRQTAALGLGDAYGMLAGFMWGLFSLAVLSPRSADSFFTRALDTIDSANAKRRIAYVVIATAVFTLLGMFAAFVLPLVLPLKAPEMAITAAQGTIVGLALAVVSFQFQAAAPHNEQSVSRPDP